MLLIGKGVCVLGALDDGPGGHQLYEASSREEHNMEVARGEIDVIFVSLSLHFLIKHNRLVRNIPLGVASGQLDIFSSSSETFSGETQSSLEEHNMEVARGQSDIFPSSSESVLRNTSFLCGT